METELNVGFERVSDVQDIFIDKLGVNNKKKAGAGLAANGVIGSGHMAADKWIRANIDDPSVMNPLMRRRLVGRLIDTRFLAPTESRDQVSKEEIFAALDKVIETGKKP